MKKISEKDLELNPNVVTNLTGSGGRAETTTPCQETKTCGESVANACTINNTPCQNTQYITRCDECNSNDNCTDEDCYKTIQLNCGNSNMCGTSKSQAIQCCDTKIEGNCGHITYPCPYSDDCETDLQCYESDDCPPIFPTETYEC